MAQVIMEVEIRVLGKQSAVSCQQSVPASETKRGSAVRKKVI